MVERPAREDACTEKRKSAPNELDGTPSVEPELAGPQSRDDFVRHGARVSAHRNSADTALRVSARPAAKEGRAVRRDVDVARWHQEVRLERPCAEAVEDVQRAAALLRHWRAHWRRPVDYHACGSVQGALADAVGDVEQEEECVGHYACLRLVCCGSNIKRNDDGRGAGDDRDRN